MKIYQYLKQQAKKLKSEISALYFAFKHERTPLLAKILIIVTVSYALSPIDLIPDFIPVIGYLDDLIILPILIMISINLIPKDIMIECRIKAKDNYKISSKTGYISAVIIIIIWMLCLGLLIFSII